MSNKPCILISNDDGIHAPALELMASALAEIATVYIVAPDRDKSGSSQSLSLHTPLQLNWMGSHKVSVQGTPADCVHLASTGLLPVKPNLVISGVNIGANLGDDVLYSGTVSAAFEACTCGIPALAFSLCAREPAYYQTALHYVQQFVLKALRTPLSPQTVLSVNIPDLPLDKIQGIKTTRLGARQPSMPMIPYVSPRQRQCFWIGKPGAPKDDQEGTDFAAIDAGFVSVTPLHIDMTHYTMIESVTDWLAT